MGRAEGRIFHQRCEDQISESQNATEKESKQWIIIVIIEITYLITAGTITA